MNSAEETVDHPVARIEALELHIEGLREAMEQSRKIALSGRAASAVGAIMLIGLLFQIIGFTPARVMLALALAIGGIVLSGSSRSTTDELKGQAELAERERDAAIDFLGLIDASRRQA